MRYFYEQSSKNIFASFQKASKMTIEEMIFIILPEYKNLWRQKTPQNKSSMQGCLDEGGLMESYLSSGGAKLR